MERSHGDQWRLSILILFHTEPKRVIFPASCFNSTMWNRVNQLKMATLSVFSFFFLSCLVFVFPSVKQDKTSVVCFSTTLHRDSGISMRNDREGGSNGGWSPSGAQADSWSDWLNRMSITARSLADVCSISATGAAQSGLGCCLLFFTDGNNQDINQQQEQQTTSWTTVDSTQEKTRDRFPGKPGVFSCAFERTSGCRGLLPLKRLN